MNGDNRSCGGGEGEEGGEEGWEVNSLREMVRKLSSGN